MSLTPTAAPKREETGGRTSVANSRSSQISTSSRTRSPGAPGIANTTDLTPNRSTTAARRSRPPQTRTFLIRRFLRSRSSSIEGDRPIWRAGLHHGPNDLLASRTCAMIAVPLRRQQCDDSDQAAVASRISLQPSLSQLETQGNCGSAHGRRWPRRNRLARTTTPPTGTSVLARPAISPKVPYLQR